VAKLDGGRFIVSVSFRLALESLGLVQHSTTYKSEITASGSLTYFGGARSAGVRRLAASCCTRIKTMIRSIWPDVYIRVLSSSIYSSTTAAQPPSNRRACAYTVTSALIQEAQR
jgi:hypothetical protein